MTLLKDRMVMLSFISKSPSRVNEYVESRVAIDREILFSIADYVKQSKTKIATRTTGDHFGHVGS